MQNTPEQNPPKWEWRLLTTHVDTDGKMRFNDLEYSWMAEKLALASLRKEGWELVRVVPIKAETTQEIRQDKYKTIMDFLPGWLKKHRNLVDKTVTVGGTYYFKRPKLE